MKRIDTQPRTMPPGPFAQAWRHGDIVYVAGQVAYDGQARQAVLGDVKTQTRQVLANLKAVLEGAGSSLEQVLKLTCILPELPRDYADFNAAFGEYFPGPHYPARTTIQAGLLGGFLVEIEAIAVCKDA